MNHDRWLVSYADFITILFAFFVVLFATGQSQKKEVELATSIQSAFRQMGIFTPPVKLSPMNKAILASPLNSTSEVMMRVRREVEQAAQPEIARGVIAVHETTDGLVISLQEAGFFDSGAADVRPSALPVLDRIAAALPGSALRVEGHTDNVPIHTPQFASNWELSSARASSIARLLLQHANIHAEQISVAGYAEYHPAASNATAEGRARNRRVDIVLLKTTVQ